MKNSLERVASSTNYLNNIKMCKRKKLSVNEEFGKSQSVKCLLGSLKYDFVKYK